MNKLILASILVVAAMSQCNFGCRKANYVPLRPQALNVLNFGCGQGSSYNNLYGVSSAGYNFQYSGLPSWITVQNGAMLAGTPPAGAGPATITVTYTDATGNRNSQVVVVAPQGTAGSTPVSVPTGISVNGGSPLSGAPGSPVTVPISQLPSAVYVPGSTAPAAPSTTTSTRTSTFSSTTTTTTSTSTTNLVTVVLPAAQYPTPTRLSIVPPDAPTTGGLKPNPAATPEDNAPVIARQEAAVRGLANALDAVNRANTNINNLQNDQTNAQNDLNNALDYLQNTRNALRDAQNAQRSNADSVTTVTTDIRNLQSQIDATNGDNNDLNNQITDITNQWNSAQGQVPVLQKNLDDILTAIANAEKALTDAQNALNNANNRLAILRKVLDDAQAALDNAPALIKRALDNLNNALDDVTRAQRALDAAKQRAAEAQKAYDDALKIKETAPKTIADARFQIDQITATLPGLQDAINNAKNTLADLINRRNAAIAAINNNNKLIDDLTNRLNTLKVKLANNGPALTNYNAQLTQAQQTLVTIRNNQQVLDDNVGTLTEQLALAENNVNNARNTIEDINSQVVNNNNLLTAARVALEKARTEKALSDQEISESIQRQGGTFPYPYIPGTGPYAMPGVTGNPASNTVNPYAPGTIFGTGPGTTGPAGAQSGLPQSVPAGSPYPTQANPNTGFGPGAVPTGVPAGRLPSRVVSIAQGANQSPVAQVGPVAPAGKGGVRTGLTNPGFGSPGACGGASTGAPASGSGRVVAISGNTLVLNNGVQVAWGECTTVRGTPKVGGSVNWDGYTNKGLNSAKNLNCY